MEFKNFLLYLKTIISKEVPLVQETKAKNVLSLLKISEE
jgi:hypothetical protein